MAIAKAAAIGAGEPPGTVVVGADTTVEFDGVIFGKPLDVPDARRMLMALGGRTHRVHTAVASWRDGEVHSAVSTTAVTLIELGAAAIEEYLLTGEPFDKAGAYALQGIGGRFVARVEGSVSGVVGMPLVQLAELLRANGVSIAR